MIKQLLLIFFLFFSITLSAQTFNVIYTIPNSMPFSINMDSMLVFGTGNFRVRRQDTVYQILTLEYYNPTTKKFSLKGSAIMTKEQHDETDPICWN